MFVAFFYVGLFISSKRELWNGKINEQMSKYENVRNEE
jgi:hypothetical protein